jgi:GNAT superfamily N-acetyltransferase
VDAIRPAQADDVPEMVALSERYRAQLETYEPQFWRKAEGAAAAQTRYFLELLQRQDVIALVHRAVEGLAGFVIATLMPAPPVYAPGGLTCMIDDFCVAEARYWPKAGAALLQEAMRCARERGAVQVVVVCPHQDQAKLTLLAGAGLHVASEWHTRGL